MRPRARLISLIGDEMVSDECVAIVELVKNAFDADASVVRVAFGGQANRPDILTISDDGCGMDLNTILTGWFEPGTVAKANATHSPKGRRYQGAKGVGRFAAARLGTSLQMETRTKNAPDGVTVRINWECFDEASYLDEVDLDYEIGDEPRIPHGTVITLNGVDKKKSWAERDYVTLHERLSRLMSPFEEIADFSIHLEIPDYPDLTGAVEPHSLTADPKYRLVGTLSADGIFNGRVLVDGAEAKNFVDLSLGKKGESVTCGEFELEIRAWDRDRRSMAPLMDKYELGLQQTRRIIDAYCGVSMYRDGFRVHPYGQQGDDWLQLDNRSRQNPTMSLANNQVIAAIRISRENNAELRDRTTREGLIHNASFESMRDWFIRILRLLEEVRYGLRPREEVTQQESNALFEAFDLSTVVHEADQQLGMAHPLSQLVRQSDQTIRDGVIRLQDHYSRLLMTAGVGQLVDLVIHELGAPLGRAGREIIHVEKQLERLLKAADRKEVVDSLGNVRAYLEQIVGLRARLNPKAAGLRGKSTTFDVREEIECNLALFGTLLAKQRIAPVVEAPNQPLVVKMMRSALGQVIANLLDNSLYWLTRHHGDGMGGLITIRAIALPSGFSICVCDDGPGVGESQRGLIFDPYYSTKPNGMGLGLFIARQVMERYGRIVYRDDCSLSGACFEAKFERNVGL